MSTQYRSVIATLAIATATFGGALSLAPLASADDSCTDVGSATVCDPSIVATPPDVSSGAQNGPYGPAGDTAPVGGKGL